MGTYTRSQGSPVQICLLGGFRLLKHGRPVVARFGGKVEALLSSLALGDAHGLPRESLLTRLWPNGDARLAAQSLNTLVYNLHAMLGGEIGGEMPVVRVAGMYRLNRAAGVDVDVSQFDSLTRQVGQQRLDPAEASQSTLDAYVLALHLYRGDLSVDSDDLSAVIERERLRARYHAVLCEMADYYQREHNHSVALDLAQRLLRSDPCRENAHRVAIRCYMRLGQRAQALHQYRVCEHMLRVEYDAAPEPATFALFEQVRQDPSSV